ncbi:MAG: glycosyltransferase [Pseudomonadota bacterium]
MTRFERQVPWQISRHSQLHHALWQFLATCSLIFGAWYLWWRWTESLNFAALWFSLPLVVAETLAYIGLILFTINIWTDRSPQPGPSPHSLRDITGDPLTPERPLVIDVFFATYNEDPEIVRKGLQAAKRLDYPHPIEVRVHVLDDGRRPPMGDVAREEGVNYITRTDNVGYKAGNLRNAMNHTSGDLIVICDADTIPLPHLLTETLGYFRDPRMAWVQTPQWFWDVPPGVPLPVMLARRFGRMGGGFGRAAEALIGPVRLGEDPFGNDPQLFYDFILRRRNWANAAFCCGAGSVHRREAVMEVALRTWATDVDVSFQRQLDEIRQLTGEAEVDTRLATVTRVSAAQEVDFTPFMLHVSEDIYTSIRLHKDREMAMANTPARGPTPKQKTKISAQTSSGTVRMISSERRLIQRSQREGARLREAGKDSRSPPITPNRVARKPISTVSKRSSAQIAPRPNQAARSVPSVSQCRSGMVFARYSPRRGNPAGMTQPSARLPSGSVYWVILKKPDRAEVAQVSTASVTATDQNTRRLRRRCWL